MKLHALLFVLVSLLIIKADAQDGQTATNMLSFADNTCAAWAKSESDRQIRGTYLYWFRGFISGYDWGNQSHQIAFDKLPNNQTIADFVDKFCRANPGESFAMAAPALVRDLVKTPMEFSK